MSHISGKLTRVRLDSCEMVNSHSKVFGVKRALLVASLCLCVGGGAGLPGGAGGTPAARQEWKPDGKALIDSGISPRADVGTTNQNVFVDKRQLRHRGFRKLDYLFRKISRSEDAVRKNVEISDVPDDNIGEKLLKSSATERNEDFSTEGTIENVQYLTENPRKILARSVTSRPAARERRPEDAEGEYLYDDDETGEDEDYDEEREEQIKIFQREAELKPQKIDDLVKNYMMSEEKWPDGNTNADVFNDDPSQEDYEQDWELRLQSDATDGPDIESRWLDSGRRRQMGPQPRRNHRVKQADIAAAVQHTLLMSTQGSCKDPQKRVVSVQSIHPNPAKHYTPQCTFLHQCGDDTGCCGIDSMTCVAKSTKRVEFHFYTATISAWGERHEIEKLHFINHTECECVPKGEFMVKDETSLLSLPTAFPRNYDDFENETPHPIKRCQCPAEYSVHILDDGECTCDCSNKQRDCMRIKRGKEYFGLKDRLCIQNGHCQTPICEFGEYIEKSGRCPKKQEKEHSRTFGK